MAHYDVHESNARREEERAKEKTKISIENIKKELKNLDQFEIEMIEDIIENIEDWKGIYNLIVKR